MRYVQFNIHRFTQDPRFHQWRRRVQGQPSWVWKLAIGAALLVIVVPIVLLTLAAVAAFGVVFGAATLAHRVGRWLGERFEGTRGASPARPQETGRRNVRVIDPRE